MSPVTTVVVTPNASGASSHAKSPSREAFVGNANIAEPIPTTQMPAASGGWLACPATANAPIAMSVSREPTDNRSTCVASNAKTQMVNPAKISAIAKSAKHAAGVANASVAARIANLHGPLTPSAKAMIVIVRAVTNAWASTSTVIVSPGARNK